MLLSELGLRDPLRGARRVGVLGLGASGRAACRLLSALGKEVFACDGGAERPVDVPDGVEVAWGTHEVGAVDALVLSPSLNPEWPENQAKPDLAALYARGVPLVSEVALACGAFGGRVLSIGGTDGKSTTAAMAHAIASASGARVLLGGNSWTAMSDIVLSDALAARDEGCAPASAAVVEVSAFQLWRGHAFQPDVALLTNVALDHLDHYASADDYVAAKAHVLARLGAGARVVLYAHDLRLERMARAARDQGARVAYYADTAETAALAAWQEPAALALRSGVGVQRAPLSVLQVPGSHNRRNALGAWLAARALLGDAVDADACARGLASFSGLPHRLALVRERAGVRYYDDSKATNVHAALVGLRSLEGPLVAIVGGVDKGLPLEPLIATLEERARAVAVIGGLRERLTREAAGRIALTPHETLEGAVAWAAEVAHEGDAVTLSPGCSSFDMFTGFEARGRAYVEAVNSLPAL